MNHLYELLPTTEEKLGPFWDLKIQITENESFNFELVKRPKYKKAFTMSKEISRVF